MLQVQILSSRPRLVNVECLDGGMVDTEDLKSFAHDERAGSNPARGTKSRKARFNRLAFLFLVIVLFSSRDIPNRVLFLDLRGRVVYCVLCLQCHSILL